MFSPSHVTHVLENRAAIKVTSARKTKMPKRLHLGCFDRPIRGWINTDVTPHIWVARTPGLAVLLWRLGRISDARYEQHRRGVFRPVRYMNAAKKFPYPDNYFVAVFSSHFLEHLHPPEAQICLSEILRTLEPGGVCRTVVPDLDIFVNSYDARDPDVFLKKLFEPSERQKNTHHWLYNANSLVSLLLETGFRRAYQCNYRQGQCPDLDALDNRCELSLYVEAIK
jgi:predicted SAM-dependent methyltransferase